MLLVLETAGCGASARSSAGSPISAAVRLSSASFAHCQGGNLSGNNYLKDVVEPSVAMSGATIVGAWQQDRWSNGGAHGIVASASKDGGKTWHHSTLPFGRCTPGGLRYDRADDSWISIGPDGAVYATAMVFDGGPAGTTRWEPRSQPMGVSPGSMRRPSTPATRRLSSWMTRTPSRQTLPGREQPMLSGVGGTPIIALHWCSPRRRMMGSIGASRE